MNTRKKHASHDLGATGRVFTIIEQTIENLGKWHWHLVVSGETTHEITTKQFGI